jgi:hypothetical protein
MTILSTRRRPEGIEVMACNILSIDIYECVCLIQILLFLYMMFYFDYKISK